MRLNHSANDARLQVRLYFNLRDKLLSHQVGLRCDGYVIPPRTRRQRTAVLPHRAKPPESVANRSATATKVGVISLPTHGAVNEADDVENDNGNAAVPINDALPPSDSHIPELAMKLARRDEKGFQSPPSFGEAPHPSFRPLPSKPSQPLFTPLRDQAAYFFFAYYVESEPPMSDIYLKWLSRLFGREPPGQILNSVVESVGLAGMANVHHAPGLMVKAKQQYGRALAITNETLRDPVKAKADSTVIAILFLGLFEVSPSSLTKRPHPFQIDPRTSQLTGDQTISYQDWRSYYSWKAHIDGAVTLLRLRGQEQFDHEFGNVIFIKLLFQLVGSNPHSSKVCTPTDDITDRWMYSERDPSPVNLCQMA